MWELPDPSRSCESEAHARAPTVCKAHISGRRCWRKKKMMSGMQATKTRYFSRVHCAAALRKWDELLTFMFLIQSASRSPLGHFFPSLWVLFSSLGSLMASKKCTFQLPEHTWAPKMLHEAPAPLSPHPFGPRFRTLKTLKKRRGNVFEGVQKWIQQ